MTVAALLLPLGALAAGEARTLYVSPNGNDAWSGTLEAASQDGSDGPLATLGGARDAVRALKQGGALPAPVKVLLRGGTYPLREAVVFGPEDTGAPETPSRMVPFKFAICLLLLSFR